MIRTRYASEVNEADDGTTQTIAGWLQDVRLMGNLAFLVIRDRTGIAQATVLKKKVPELHELAGQIQRESAVSITGTVQMSDKAKLGWEILPDNIQVLNESEAPLPMGVVDRVGVDLDTRLDNRFLDVRRPEVAAIFKIRHEVIHAAGEYLRDKGFLEIHTSCINAASSEGGTEVYKFQYFEKEAFLAQSPQLYKQMMMATGFDRVFEFARYFRAEKHNTTRHLNESTAIDFEMAWIQNEEDVMKVIEGLMNAIWTAVHEKRQEELALVGAEVPIPKLPFLRITYTDAIEKINKASLNGDRKLDKPLEFGDDIGTEAERILGDVLMKEGHDFYFITKWPLAPKPFYVHPEGKDMGSKLCRGFDLDYRGVELLSGAQRIHEPELLKEGIKRVGLDPTDFEGYLTSFRYGMPPHGGCGIGIERILMQMLGLPNIREAVLFPRDRTRLYP
ncbi:MAG: aspartate--tRNA(Asn) ligase [Euryarchaeota archaeon]|nr:aspartate--tRNA(Asn) ligase [Euryarchaeota archaeon]